MIYAVDQPRGETAGPGADRQQDKPHGDSGKAGRNGRRSARPIWNGDRFQLRPGRTIGGGQGRVPPYRFSSASGPGGGWFQPHTDSDPAAHGVALVDDPTGMESSTAKNEVRRVIKITTDERRSYAGRYVRVDLQGPPILGPGDDRWVIAEIYLPKSTPVLPT
ncbi:MAG: hypothetical protein ACRDPL_00695, partial [Propionibacteriaceae bacterium]